MADKPYRRDKWLWHIPVRGPEGRFEVQAAFVVDASGENAVIYPARSPTHAQNLGYLCPRAGLAHEDVETHIEA